MAHFLMAKHAFARLIASMVLAAAFAFAASAQSTSIDQITANSLMLRQAGTGNLATAEQTAVGAGLTTTAGNLASIEQNGTSNTTNLAQYGSDHEAIIRQSGQGHSATIAQNGTGLGIRVEQFGTDRSVAVTQSGVGAGEPITIRQYTHGQ